MAAGDYSGYTYLNGVRLNRASMARNRGGPGDKSPHSFGFATMGKFTSDYIVSLEKHTNFKIYKYVQSGCFGADESAWLPMDNLGMLYDELPEYGEWPPTNNRFTQGPLSRKDFSERSSRICTYSFPTPSDLGFDTVGLINRRLPLRFTLPPPYGDGPNTIIEIYFLDDGDHHFVYGRMKEERTGDIWHAFSGYHVGLEFDWYTSDASYYFSVLEKHLNSRREVRLSMLWPDTFDLSKITHEHEPVLQYDPD